MLALRRCLSKYEHLRSVVRRIFIQYAEAKTSGLHTPDTDLRRLAVALGIGQEGRCEWSFPANILGPIGLLTHHVFSR